MIVTLNIDDYNVHYILVDSGKLMDVLFYDDLFKMDIFPKWLKRLDAPIMMFLREPVSVEGIIVLPVIAGSAPQRC